VGRIRGSLDHEELLKPLWPFLIAEVIILFLLTYFPGLVMFLPRALDLQGGSAVRRRTHRRPRAGGWGFGLDREEQAGLFVSLGLPSAPRRSEGTAGWAPGRPNEGVRPHPWR